MITLKIKPLSVNEMYRRVRYRSSKYNAFEEKLVYTLLPKLKIPDGQLQAHYEFGVSSTRFDVDNAIKPFQDVLQVKYGFDDKRIVYITALKVKVKRGEEYIKFSIKKYN